MMSFAGKANRTGNQLELIVENLLVQKGYSKIEGHERHLMLQAKKVLQGKKYGMQVHIGKTIYETTRKCDFLIFNEELFKSCLVIECKWQQVSGSVDEKYPYLVFNIMKLGIDTIVLLDGEGYSEKAMRWLKSMTKESQALKHVFSLKEFMKEVNNGLLG